jgi:amidase
VVEASIGMYEDKLHCVITVNPHALDEATERDREMAQGRIRGPQHGILIALKDNILTHPSALALPAWRAASRA